jgi:SsrA-binding protein
MSGSAPEEKNLATNRQAYHRYFILEKLEAGIALEGAEVKSIRGGNVNLKDAYARVSRGEAFLLNCHISAYPNAGPFAPEPTRERKLLLHRHEIQRLQAAADRDGHTLVPLRLYLKGRRIKIEIGVAKGKKTHDKRDAKRRETIEREARQAESEARRR